MTASATQGIGRAGLVTPRASGAVAFPIVDSPAIEREPPVAAAHAPLGNVIDLMLSQRVAAVPVLAGGRRYQGTCTMAAILGCLLPVQDAARAAVPSLAFLRESIERVRARAAPVLSRPAGSCLDPGIATLDPAASVTEAILLLSRGAPLVAVVDNEDLVGTVTWEGALRAARPGG
jgi:CBS domain-containing protein